MGERKRIKFKIRYSFGKRNLKNSLNTDSSACLDYI
jgi:hypothetical protein